jgi:hypothetical protein
MMKWLGRRAARLGTGNTQNRRLDMKTLGRACAAVVLIAGPALAQSSIDPVNKFSWQENCGWMNWRDADGASQGVRDRMTFLAGSIWGENFGWVRTGDGSPSNGVQYANSSGADFGVNISMTGALSGFAWGENVGWINFGGGAMAAPPDPARIDLSAGRLRGWAWGENIGWVNLDLAARGQFVGTACYANCDGSSAAPVLNVNDFICFQNLFAAGDPAANCDRSTSPPALNVNDFVCFQSRFAAGCP